MRIVDVSGVVIEGCESSDRGDHHGHRVSVAAEALEEARHLLVNHRVARDAMIEVLLLLGGRKLTVKQQVAGFEEVALFCELFDRVAAIQKNAGVAIDVGDLGIAAAGGGEAGVVGEHPGLGIELADVDDVRPDGAAEDREIDGLPFNRQRSFFGVGFCIHREVPGKCCAGQEARLTGVI